MSEATEKETRTRPEGAVKDAVSKSPMVQVEKQRRMRIERKTILFTFGFLT
jgi:hypothetical protein